MGGEGGPDDKARQARQSGPPAQAPTPPPAADRPHRGAARAHRRTPCGFGLQARAERLRPRRAARSDRTPRRAGPNWDHAGVAACTVMHQPMRRGVMAEQQRGVNRHAQPVTARGCCGGSAHARRGWQTCPNHSPTARNSAARCPATPAPTPPQSPRTASGSSHQMRQRQHHQQRIGGGKFWPLRRIGGTNRPLI